MWPQSKKSNSRGFTLVELLVVISIIGTLSSVVLVNMGGMKQQAAIAKSRTFLASIQQKIGIDLVGAWDLDEGSGAVAKDASGNGNDGAISGAVYVQETPKGNGIAGQYALNFDGVADCLNAGNQPSLQLVDDMTISIWVYPTNILHGRENPIDKAYGGEFALTQETSGSLSYFHGPNGGEVAGYMSRGWANVFSNNVWINLVLTRKVSTHSVKLYVNGQYRGEGGAGWQDPSVSAQSVTIGCGYAGTGFHGIVDEARIYSQPLELVQISSQYLVGLDKLFANGRITRSEYDQRASKVNKEYAAARN